MNNSYTMPEGFAERMHELYLSQPNGTDTISSATGIPKSTVYAVCYYGRTCNIAILAKLAKYFKVSADWLLFGTGEKQLREWKE